MYLCDKMTIRFECCRVSTIIIRRGLDIIIVSRVMRKVEALAQQLRCPDSCTISRNIYKGLISWLNWLFAIGNLSSQSSVSWMMCNYFCRWKQQLQKSGDRRAADIWMGVTKSVQLIFARNLSEIKESQKWPVNLQHVVLAFNCGFVAAEQPPTNKRVFGEGWNQILIQKQK